MNINALVVCVNFHDLLERTLPTWEGFNQISVITTPEDSLTIELCRERGVPAFQTRGFYERGAVFNKAQAMVRFMEQTDFLETEGWRCFIDADICLPAGWRQILEAANLQPGNLYSARRRLEDGRVCQDVGEMPGYFHLFHSSDPNVRKQPLLDVNWRAAHGYDSEFQGRWDPEKRIWLATTVLHLGEPGQNWWGRGDKDHFAKMYAARRAQGGGIAPMEKIEPS